MADKDIVPIHIDLNNPNRLNETSIQAFGTAIKMILQQMFGQNIAIPVTITGTNSQIDSFTKTLAGEKRYFETYRRLGLHDPRTHEDKYRLNIAIDKFERDTGIKWPFK